MSVVENAFKELFAKEYNNLCRYALSYVQDSHMAEDVVQETFVKFWEQRRELAQSHEAKFYLITAVRNNCITALRKQEKSGTRLVEEAPDNEAEPFMTTREVHEDANEQARLVAQALDQLPPKCKEVFLLVKMHGMSYKQAAETLDISIKTVENQMGKAIKTLRDFTRSAVILLAILIFIKNMF